MLPRLREASPSLNIEVSERVLDPLNEDVLLRICVRGRRVKEAEETNTFKQRSSRVNTPGKTQAETSRIVPTRQECHPSQGPIFRNSVFNRGDLVF